MLPQRGRLGCHRHPRLRASDQPFEHNRCHPARRPGRLREGSDLEQESVGLAGGGVGDLASPRHRLRVERSRLWGLRGKLPRARPQHSVADTFKQVLGKAVSDHHVAADAQDANPSLAAGANEGVDDRAIARVGLVGKAVADLVRELPSYGEQQRTIRTVWADQRQRADDAVDSGIDDGRARSYPVSLTG